MISALHRIRACALTWLALAALVSGAEAAGLAGGINLPAGGKIAEQAMSDGVLSTHVAPLYRLSGGDLVGWTVSARTSVIEGEAGTEPTRDSALRSRFDLNTEAVDAAWTCTVDLPRAGMDAAQGQSMLQVGMPAAGIFELPIVGGPARLDLEWSGAGTSLVDGGILVPIRAMLGDDALAPHEGQLQGRMRWSQGLILTAVRQWAGDEGSERARSGLGVRRAFHGDGWRFEIGGAAGEGHEGDAATESLVLDGTGRVVSLPGAVLSVSADYERKWVRAEDSESLSLEFGADLTSLFATAFPDVLQPRLHLGASVGAMATDGDRLELQAVGGRVEMSWRF